MRARSRACALNTGALGGPDVCGRAANAPDERGPRSAVARRLVFFVAASAGARAEVWVLLSGTEAIADVFGCVAALVRRDHVAEVFVLRRAWRLRCAVPVIIRDRSAATAAASSASAAT